MSKNNRERRRQRKHLPSYGRGVIAACTEALAAGTMRPGEVYTVDVLHDDWCALLKGTGPCNCNPTVCAPKRVPSPQEN
jgi:hypothetical protein